MPTVPSNLQSQLIHSLRTLVGYGEVRAAGTFLKQEVNLHLPQAFTETVEQTIFSLLRFAESEQKPLSHVIAEYTNLQPAIKTQIAELDQHLLQIEQDITPHIPDFGAWVASLKDEKRPGHAILDAVAPKIHANVKSQLKVSEARAHKDMKQPKYLTAEAFFDDNNYILAHAENVHPFSLKSALYVQKLEQEYPALHQAALLADGLRNYEEPAHGMLSSTHRANTSFQKQVNKALAYLEEHYHEEITAQTHQLQGTLVPLEIGKLHPKQPTQMQKLKQAINKTTTKLKNKATGIFSRAEPLEEEAHEANALIQEAAQESHAAVASDESIQPLEALTEQHPDESPEAPSLRQRIQNGVDHLIAAKEKASESISQTIKNTVNHFLPGPKAPSEPMSADAQANIALGVGTLAAGSTIASEVDKRSTESQVAHLEGRKPEKVKMGFENITGTAIGATGIFWGLATKLRESGAFKTR